ncbi:MAG TPA: general secretion pathway protein GspB [Steroidobacteraceae bacterium]|jgi:general secretion pathway protein B|nr:general secretion pathway protein GspB [Steroidobacteraceae bacterium]
MSLILDALKKSEAERQRQSGPTLLEVRVARPQRRYPLWALAVAILLAVNMVLLLVFVLRPSDSGRASSLTASTTTLQPPPAVTAPASPASALSAPAATMPAQPAAAQPGTSSSASPTLADNSTDPGANPADNEPAISPIAAGLRAQRDMTRADYSTLPGINEMAANVPDLRLDLHVYAERPRDRYALINMQTVHEGDTLSEGPRVLAITRDGVALEWHSQQFMLRPQ